MSEIILEPREGGDKLIQGPIDSYSISPGNPVDVTVSSGDVCTVKPDNQYILVDLSGGSAGILGKNVPDNKNARLKVLEVHGSDVNLATSANKDSGTIANSFLQSLAPYNPLEHLIDLDHPAGSSRIANSSTSIKVAGQTLNDLGITCKDPNGKPSVPVLSFGDVRTIAETVTGKPVNAR